MSNQTLSTHTNFDFDQLVFGAETRSNANGGKYVQVAYKGKQVEFQLGQASQLLRVPFGLDSASREDPSKKCIKMELNAETLHFIQKLEEATLKAAKVNSKEWFRRNNMSEHDVKAMFCSSIKESDSFAPCVKINVKTEGNRQSMVDIAKWKGGLPGGKLTKPKVGTPADIKYNATCMAQVRIGSGVWFKGNQFGTSLVATRVLCVNSTEEGPNRPITDFAMDVEMTDASDSE